MDELEVNYIIEKLTKIEYDNFINMFIDYFINDMGVKYDVDKLKENLVKGFILKSYEKNLIFIDVIGNSVKMFVNISSTSSSFKLSTSKMITGALYFLLSSSFKFKTLSLCGSFVLIATTNG